MVVGAVLAPVLISRTSLSTSFLVLGAATVVVTLACLVGLRGLDAASRRRAEALASRVAIIDKVPLAQGVPQIVLERARRRRAAVSLRRGSTSSCRAPAHAFYIVVEGEVVVHRGDTEVIRLGPGRAVRRARPARPRAAERDRDDRGRQHVLRLDGSVLLDALEAAPTMRSELVERRSRPGAGAATALVDDPRVGAGVSADGATVVGRRCGLRGQARDPRPDGRARRPARHRGRAGPLVGVAGGGGDRRGVAAAPVVGDADRDAQAVLDALAAAACGQTAC